MLIRALVQYSVDANPPLDVHVSGDSGAKETNVDPPGGKQSGS
jgi:hypothetical protein